jgi:hypothetical protein
MTMVESKLEFLVGILVLTLAQVSFRITAMCVRAEYAWLEIVGVTCACISPLVYKIYFNEKTKANRNKSVLAFGMAVDIFGFAASIAAITGQNKTEEITADIILVFSMVATGLLWIFPHWKKPAKSQP